MRVIHEMQLRQLKHTHTERLTGDKEEISSVLLHYRLCAKLGNLLQ